MSLLRGVSSSCSSLMVTRLVVVVVGVALLALASFGQAVHAHKVSQQNVCLNSWEAPVAKRAARAPLTAMDIQQCNPYPFGPFASNFSIFASGSVNISCPEGIEERIGAGSQIKLRSCNVGNALPVVSVSSCSAPAGSNQYPNVLLAGDRIDVSSDCSVKGGHIVSGSSATTVAPAAFKAAASYSCKIKVDKTAVDYAAVANSAAQFSTQLFKSPITTHAVAAKNEPSGTLTIRLTKSPVEYVELGSALLATAKTILVDETVSPLNDKTIIITVANGPPIVQIDRLDSGWLAGNPSHVIWNFVNVGTINIKNTVLWGTILAPGSQIVATGVSVRGHVFAGSVTGQISVQKARFDNSQCAGATAPTTSNSANTASPSSAATPVTSPVAAVKTCNLPLWSAIADAIVQSYGSVCSDDARSALRLAYSDSATFSAKNAASPGGADGSAVLAEELAWPENKGFIANTILALQARFSGAQAPVSRADLIQLAAALAVVTCFPGPSVPFSVGRPDATVANPAGRLPDVFDTADDILAAFADMGLNSTETVALMGAHSIGKQRYVDPSHPGAPLDSSPNGMDAQYYADVLQADPPTGTFRLPSDHKLARNVNTKDDWNVFAHDPKAWSAAFSAAMSKMSALGVTAPLVSCPVIPAGPPSLSPTTLGALPPSIVLNGLAVCDMNIWANVHSDIALTIGPVCSDVARAAIKLAYMDAATWSDNFGDGGADGSILWFAAEQNRRENSGLTAVIAALAPIPAQRKVSAADVIQLAAAYSIHLCTPGPLLNFKVGRVDALTENPASRIPSPADTIDTLLARFQDMGFTTGQFVALLGAHSTAKNRYTNVSAFGVALDSTVDNFDNQYYKDMRATDSPVGTSPLRSDRALAQDSRTGPFFTTYAANSTAWINEFSSAWNKLAYLGVPPNTLVNCPVLALSTAAQCDMDLWTTVRDDILRDVYDGGKCNDNAKRAIRLMFHDAGTYSRTFKDGGADGSLLLFPDELARPDNAGLEEVVAALIPIVKKNNVGAADVTQLSGALATVICNMGPQMPFRVGRYDATSANPENRLPNVHDTVDNIVARFLDMDARLDHIMVSALLGAHSTGKQRHTDLDRVGFPLDSTPDEWDILYYSQAMQDVQEPGTARLPVDYTFGHDPKTKPIYRFYSVNEDDWNKDFVAAMNIVADLGVTHTLQVCPIIPSSTNPFSFGMKEV
ncbi:hypothetical protein HDU90_008124 [Geranomyces variabilis]|nr:hypothetical protein HDU90_008124 [Geranomyces variabilis]